MSAPSHRPRRTAFASLVAAVAIAALPALADARPIVDHGMPAIPVNAPGTDVAAQDQQAPRPIVNARDRRRRAGPAGAAADRQRAGDRRRRRRPAGAHRRQPQPGQPRRRPGRLAADARGARTDRAWRHARRPGAGLQAHRHAPTDPRGGLNSSCGSSPKRPAPAGRFRVSALTAETAPGARFLAEGEGFEPSKDSRPCRFSRPVHSTTLPPLRSADAQARRLGAAEALHWPRAGRGGRVAEGTRLLSEYGVTSSIAGSNPALSALPRRWRPQDRRLHSGATLRP